jgi:hypothetical protein
MFKLISESVNLCKIQSFLKLQHFCYAVAIAVAKAMAIEKSYGVRCREELDFVLLEPSPIGEGRARR